MNTQRLQHIDIKPSARFRATWTLGIALLATSCAEEVLDPEDTVTVSGEALTQSTDANAFQGQSTSAMASLGWRAVEVPGMPERSVWMASSSGAVACADGYVCFYQHGNLGGEAMSLQGSLAIGNLALVECRNCANGVWNDQMSSWVNFSGQRYCWWSDAYEGGEVFPMGDGAIQNALPRENDRASSLGPC